MKRFYIAAVAGLCWIAPGSAQEGSLAPTTPIVPPPMLYNGSLVAPVGGQWGTSGSRLFSRTTWSPVRSPVVPGETGYTAVSPTGYSVLPLPTGVGATGQCGPVGCGTTRGVNWDRLKAWLCYHPSKTELPRLQLSPSVTPIQGLFSCAPSSSCANGSATSRYSAPPQPAFVPPPPPTMPPPAGAGAVMTPPRGPQGAAVQPTWQGRVTPAPVVNAGYRPGQK